MNSAEQRQIRENAETPPLSNGVYRNGAVRDTDLTSTQATALQSQAGLKVTEAEYWQLYYSSLPK